MTQVEIYENIDGSKFRKLITAKRKPIIIRKQDIGPCLERWTAEYLAEKVGCMDVKIHVSPESKMDFIKKNFLYKTLPFDELVARSCGKSKQYFIKENEFYYLRSLGTDPRGKDIANFHSQYPALAGDVNIPHYFDENRFFSSVLRLSSSGVTLWTHYDIMDNILMQIQGRKQVVLWAPSETLNMYLSGDKSLVIDIDNPDLNRFPNFPQVKKYECILEPGDILFIPALWFHNTTAIDFSVALNVFWKHLDDELYDKKDPYGNKDLVSGARALQSVGNSIKLLDQLPVDYQDFYLRRMMILIENKLNDLNKQDKKEQTEDCDNKI